MDGPTLREPERDDEVRQVESRSYCLSGNKYSKFPITSGQRFEIRAWIDGGCDSRGWTNDRWKTSCGPLGRPGIFIGDALVPTSQVGMLVGALSTENAGDQMQEDEAYRIFRSMALQVGDHFESVSPLNGFLYLIMNDSFTYGDNEGAIRVRVTYH